MIGLFAREERDAKRRSFNDPLARGWRGRNMGVYLRDGQRPPTRCQLGVNRIKTASKTAMDFPPI